MEGLIQAGQLFFSLSILIVLHELGHFVPAKLFKIKVEKFYLFFDPWFSLFKKKIGDTVYGIGWLPLGGYVKIAGMVDESMDKEQLEKPAEPWEFRSKPAWQRLIVMLGGVTVNAILAVIIYIFVLWSYGTTILPNENVKDGIWVTDAELSKKLGLQSGDKIVAVDGKDVAQDDINRVLTNIIFAKSITINRADSVFEFSFPVGYLETLIDHKDKGPVFSLRLPFEVAQVMEDSVTYAFNAGIKANDEIVSVNGTKIKYYDEFKSIIENKANDTVLISVKRGDEVLTLPTLVGPDGKIGIMVNFYSLPELQERGIYQTKKIEYSFWEAIPAGWQETGTMLTLYYKNFKKIFDVESGAYKGLGGFKAFGQMYTASWDWEQTWRNTAFISIILAFMNLLPIPALDGGHVMFLLYELITGRKPHQKVLEYAQMAGMILLLSLVLYANINDWI
jgi:regulator of sigma E protease